jgi:glutamate synthase domain-containing protein 2/glutamate synthase domain-containing protein 1/glutamate synthase domain-containing protein 3
MRNESRDELLYDPQDQHDACGVGFVANISGHASHDIVSYALDALCNLTHRGAVDADGRTGDGAGLLTQLPLKFFRREVARLGKSPAGDLAVGMFFLPSDESAEAFCRQIVEQVVDSFGITLLGWRHVPVDQSVLGTKARRTAPRIEQLFVARNDRAGEFEKTLNRARREIERRAAKIEDFYVPSFSCRTIVYKGLMVGNQLGPFYKDLSEPGFEAALAVFHQRYSTNTFPNWSLAQPFRLLAHNGEINTISGNRRWMQAREIAARKPLDTGEFRSSIWNKGSDSASLDNALEQFEISGLDVVQSLMMMIPEAYEKSDDISPELRAFYDYGASTTEPWDGPAAVAFTDGRIVGAALDRNGLRPARYAVTRSGLVLVASEAGVIDLDPETVVQKGRLGPGQMIAVDTKSGILLTNDQIKRAVASRHRYEAWVRRSVVPTPDGEDCQTQSIDNESAFVSRMKGFGYTLEDIDKILGPMLVEGKEPIGSMGDDTPLAVLSSKPRLLYSYFKQRFAQVTNPAIDPIRERSVMSLTTLLGPRGEMGAEPRARWELIKLLSPIVSEATVSWLKRQGGSGVSCLTLPAVFDVAGAGDGLKRALTELCLRASEAVDAGFSILIISNLGTTDTVAPIPMLLAIAAVHNHLIGEGQRLRASLVARTGDARDDHHIACLIGFGANAVSPRLAFDVIAREGLRRGLSVSSATKNYRTALEDGLLKIMAKMGISTVSGYCGSQTFEIVGLDKNLVEDYFTGAPCRLSGIGLEEIAGEVLRFHEAARASAAPTLDNAGFFRYRFGGEYHSYNPAVFRALHRAAARGDADEYARYANEVLGRPPMVLRDLLEFGPAQPIALDEVESAGRVLARFSTSAMSMGALSRKAHETLAIAMNRMGAKSNSGEGGEDSRRYKRRLGGDLANSRIKQVASARFGVTPEYLVSADELEIKIAQGSKPGEGGQLPGHKVTAEIAAIRHSTPGVTLISPPPHHDIYSIEDLAQLIYDLKQINPEARIAVKLVSEAGIGTIAAGVAKAGADVINISGHDGGTGASPLGSIKNAGTPWELGLAETQQALVMNGLRRRVRLRVDGGMKTGRDVIIAALLGADEFGFATAAVVALGCVMARQCHLNTCPVGIATQDPALRRKFTGTPERVVRFFEALAEDVRRLLAELGFQSVDDIVGRSDLLSQKTGLKFPKPVNIDLRPMLRRADERESSPIPSDGLRSLNLQSSLADAIDAASADAIRNGSIAAGLFGIRNTDRAIGARLAGAIARRYGDAGLPDGTIDLTFAGAAGQSFGAFNIAGVRLRLIGEANDYVGKGMSGGEIVIHPADSSRFVWSENVVIGNTVMYGATGGTLFAAGQAGERFCIRNSGGVAVVEGVGDHACEYMTAGVVVVLGEAGRNFAAGMTGGVAFVLDEFGDFRTKCNRELVELVSLADEDGELVRQLIERHGEMTGSSLASELLTSWESSRNLFWKVVTQAESARGRGTEPSHQRFTAPFRPASIAVAD